MFDQKIPLQSQPRPNTRPPAAYQPVLVAHQVSTMAVTVHYIDNLMKLLQLEENQGQDSPIKPVPADVPKIAFVGAGRDDRRRYCSLCKSNREPKQIYTSHWIRDLHGKVTCPVLYANKCQLCGATGPDSHTRSYCPRISEFRKAHRNTPEAYLFENYKSLMERGRARKGE